MNIKLYINSKPFHVSKPFLFKDPLCPITNTSKHFPIDYLGPPKVIYRFTSPLIGQIVGVVFVSVVVSGIITVVVSVVVSVIVFVVVGVVAPAEESAR